MHPWKAALREGLVSGSLASLLSTAALLVAGRRQNGSAVAPVNAVSHWLWGDRALRENDADWRHTALGYAVHHGAAVFWGVLHARLWGRREEAKEPVPALVGGAAAASVACFVDYQLTPKRLTPGFEHRLTTPAMVAVYACFALGIAAGSLMVKARD